MSCYIEEHHYNLPVLYTHCTLNRPEHVGIGTYEIYGETVIGLATIG